MNQISCGIVSVIIGRDFTLSKLLDYFKNVHIPENTDINLYLVLGCTNDFTQHLKTEVERLGLKNKYNNIYYIKGNLKCHSNLNWDEWETVSRKKDPDLKHRAALENINIALEATKNETYIHFVDDDTIPPYNALADLLKSYQTIPNCGIASGIYFNKEWVEPTIAVRADEAKRRIVGSIEKEKWLGCSIDDLAVSNYKDIGFVGNGCMLVSGDDVQKILPLTEFREQADDIAPPDFIICRRIRRLGKIISIVPSVTAVHLDYEGNPVGLPPEYLEGVKTSNTTSKILIIHYNKYFNYSKLSKEFDQIIVLNHIEINSKSLTHLKKFNNIQVIQKSIVETCKKYNHYRNYLKIEGESMIYAALEESYKILNKTYDYEIHAYFKNQNILAKIEAFDSKNLKKLLNQKP